MVLYCSKEGADIVVQGILEMEGDEHADNDGGVTMTAG
jgi:hypothetical protein